MMDRQRHRKPFGREMLKHESKSYPSECGSITLHGDEKSKSWDLRAQRDLFGRGKNSENCPQKYIHVPPSFSRAYWLTWCVTRLTTLQSPDAWEETRRCWPDRSPTLVISISSMTGYLTWISLLQAFGSVQLWSAICDVVFYHGSAEGIAYYQDDSGHSIPCSSLGSFQQCICVLACIWTVLGVGLSISCPHTDTCVGNT